SFSRNCLKVWMALEKTVFCGLSSLRVKPLYQNKKAPVCEKEPLLKLPPFIGVLSKVISVRFTGESPQKKGSNRLSLAAFAYIGRKFSAYLEISPYSYS